MINFKSYQDGAIDLDNIGEQIRSLIPIEDYFILSPRQLAYNALKHFNFRKVEETEGSVTKYCQKILQENKLLKKLDDPIHAFLVLVLNRGKNILKIKNRLEIQARQHLNQVEQIIDFYLTLPYIIKFRIDAVKPTNNTERKQLEFYKRCMEKKNEIVNFILNIIPYRARELSIKKKVNLPQGLEDIYEQIDYHNNFPYTELLDRYRYVYGLNLEKLDYRLINPLHNKKFWIDENLWQHTTYTTPVNKGFQQKIKAEPFFSTMILSLKELPFSQNREEIFLELCYLFKKKKWFAFYALALPQVEGIFNEMLEMTDSKKSKNSLSDKAKSIRNYHDDADYTMDYYEFTLADLRNSFSHSGVVDNPKLKSYHLVMDIQYLLDMCTELDSPISKLSKQIREGVEAITHVGHLSDFLELVAQIDKDKKLPSIKKKIEDFMYDNVLKKINLKLMITKLENDFKDAIISFNKNINLIMISITKYELNIFTRTFKEIKELSPSLEVQMNKLAILIEDYYKLLVNTNSFLDKFPKYFPGTSKKLLKQIEDFKTSHQNELKKIYYLSTHINLPLSSFFTIHKSKMTHIIT